MSRIEIKKIVEVFWGWRVRFSPESKLETELVNKKQWCSVTIYSRIIQNLDFSPATTSSEARGLQDPDQVTTSSGARGLKTLPKINRI